MLSWYLERKSRQHNFNNISNRPCRTVLCCICVSVTRHFRWSKLLSLSRAFKRWHNSRQWRGQINYRRRNFFFLSLVCGMACWSDNRRDGWCVDIGNSHNVMVWHRVCRLCWRISCSTGMKWLRKCTINNKNNMNSMSVQNKKKG